MAENSLPDDPYPKGFLYALGSIVAIWSNIEDDARAALYHLADISGSDAQMIIGHMAFRDRLDTLKAVCYGMMPYEDFVTCEKWINHVAIDLRNYRNRLIHDEWGTSVFNPGNATRINLKTKITREKGSGDIRLQLESHVLVSVNELLSFGKDLLDTRAAFFEMAQYSKETGFKNPPPPLALRHKSFESQLTARLFRSQIQRAPKPPRQP